MRLKVGGPRKGKNLSVKKIQSNIWSLWSSWEAGRTLNAVISNIETSDSVLLTAIAV